MCVLDVADTGAGRARPQMTAVSQTAFIIIRIPVGIMNDRRLKLNTSRAAAFHFLSHTLWCCKALTFLISASITGDIIQTPD